MSVIDRPGDDEGLCPHCCGEGEVYLDGIPHFCVPCKGTGLVGADDEEPER